ncbi:MAG TPA: 2-phospho-L-lactate transferase CofD family protein [Solirubrobacteraceae bacterium]|nr:2-phospho-L-lactate transferase CofD family protein [Solirubrobacteraceae bacterium]
MGGKLSDQPRVVLLSGGTGGAKLARGMLEVVGADRLAVIANTGDDIEIYGARVSPDPDLIAFWLADRIDERGWGIAGDTFAVMEGLRELGVEVWFNLGDRDLAWCLERARLEAAGASASEAHAQLCARIGVRAQVIPMSDHPYRTIVNGACLQEHLIRAGAAAAVRSVRYLNAQGSEQPPPPSPAAARAIAEAALVVIGPSNPVISIAPILNVLKAQLLEAPAPIVAVSPIVAGAVLKGPTAAFMAAVGRPATAAGVLDYYQSLLPGRIAGMLADEELAPDQSPCLLALASTLMSDADSRTAVARRVLALARTLQQGEAA